MTRNPGREDELPVFDALEPDGGDRRQALTGSGRRPLGPARGAGAAAAVLALLIVGIVIGSPPPSDSTKSPDPSASHPAGPSGSATAAACALPARGQFPTVVMGLEGSRRQVTGLFGFGSGYGQQSQAPGWQVPPSGQALITGQGDRPILRTSQGICFRHVVVDYASTPTVPGANVVPLFNSPLTRSVGDITLDALPDGDWTIRVTAHFEMLGTVDGDVVTVTYFRILAGAGPSVVDPPSATPWRAPLVTPAVPCGTRQPTADLTVTMFVDGGVSAPGSSSDSLAPSVVHARLGDPIVLITDGEICATRWRIDLTDQATGTGTTIDAFEDPADDPAYAAQNRWPISTTGDQIVSANLTFPGGLEIARAWHLIIDPFAAPPLFLIGPNGTKFEGTIGCGLYFHLSNGYESSTDCPSIDYAPTPAALQVGPFDVIHLDVPGWSVVTWGASCGRVTTADLPQFESPGGCGLGSGSTENGGPLSDRPAFVVPRGDTIVMVGLSAVDAGGNQFGATYFAHVIGR